MSLRNNAGGSGGMNSNARNALFGGATAARLPAGGAGAGSGAASGMRDALESDNDRLIGELEKKVSALKHATLSIHDEVQADNRMLSGMSVDFDKTGALMSGTMKRLEGLVRYGGGSSHMCKLIAFVIALFFGLWLLVGRGK